MIFKIIDKYRKEAQMLHNSEYRSDVSWRHAILETIFKPKYTVPGKERMTHLHPRIKELHLPDKVYISDWRKYQVEDHPALVRFQKRCHAAGLHDPWLRNFAFGFYPRVSNQQSVTRIIFNKCLTGFCIAFTLFAGEKIYDHYYPTIYQHTEEYIKKHGVGPEKHH